MKNKFTDRPCSILYYKYAYKHSFSVDDCTKWTKCQLYQEMEMKGNIITWPLRLSTTGSDGTNVDSTTATTSNSTAAGSSNTAGSKTSKKGLVTSTAITSNNTGPENTGAAFRQRPTQLAKIVEEKIPVSDFCEYKALTMLILPSQRTFKDSIHACQQLKSTIHTYKDSVSNVLPEAPKESWSDCIWTGHTRNSNGQFVARFDGNSSFDKTNLKWMWGEPNGDEIQECSTLHGKMLLHISISILVSVDLLLFFRIHLGKKKKHK